MEKPKLTVTKKAGYNAVTIVMLFKANREIRNWIPPKK